MVKVDASTLKGKGSNLRNGVFVVNGDKLIEYFPMLFFIIIVYLG
jgi:hypothetical protein